MEAPSVNVGGGKFYFCSSLGDVRIALGSKLDVWSIFESCLHDLPSADDGNTSGTVRRSCVSWWCVCVCVTTETARAKKTERRHKERERERQDTQREINKK